MLLGITVLSGCGGGSTDQATGAAGQTQVRVEAWCAMQGLQPSLRQTFIVIDGRNLQPAQDGNEFATKNHAVRDAVMSFVDPDSAIANGRSAPRERITLMVAPTDGSAPRQLFTGCLPGLSRAERMSAMQGESRVAHFFSGGKTQELDDAAGDFKTKVTEVLVAAAKSAVPAAPSEVASPLLASLAATGHIFRSTDTVPRIILVSDYLPQAEAKNLTAARQEALAEAARNNVDLGDAEVIALGKGGNDETRRAFLQMYLLRLNGRLVSWSADASGVTPSPTPATLRRYAGTAQFPGSPQGIVRIRLATDSNGKLVNSWLILSGEPYERAIPLTGLGVCDETNACRFHSDNDGFAHVWMVKRDEESSVQFDSEAPFGGMRDWTLETSGSNLKGKIFDSAVSQVGAVPGQKSIGIQANLDPKANY